MDIATLNGLVVNRNETKVGVSLEDLVLGSMGRRRDQITQPSASGQRELSGTVSRSRWRASP